MMRKYKISIGLCGPEVISTGIIKAADAREAAKKYLDSCGEAYSERDLDRVASQAWLVENESRDADPFVDICGKKLKVGDLVAFVQKIGDYGLKINTGKVDHFTDAKVFINSMHVIGDGSF